MCANPQPATPEPAPHEPRTPRWSRVRIVDDTVIESQLHIGSVIPVGGGAALTVEIVQRHEPSQVLGFAPLARSTPEILIAGQRLSLEEAEDLIRQLERAAIEIHHSWPR